MTKRSAMLAFMAVVLMTLTVLSRAPWSRPIVVMTDTPSTIHPETTARPAVAVEVGRGGRAETLPHYTEPDRAGIVAYVEGRLNDALELFTKAVADDPRDAESLSNLGQVLVKLGRHDDAIRRFEQALRINPSRWAYHFNLAHALGQAGQWDRAVVEYQSAVALSPSEYVTHYNLGRALHERGLDREAVEAYQAAIDLNPTDASFYLSLGRSYETLERWDDALAAYQQFLRLDSSSPTATQLRSHIAGLMENQNRSRAGG